MSKIIKISIVSLITLVVFLGSFSCGQTISSEEYEGVKNELAESKSLVTELENELSLARSAEAELQELSSNYEELKQQNDANVKELKSLEAQYEVLSAENEDIRTQNEAYLKEIVDLEEKLEAVTPEPEEPPEETPPEVNEENIKQALFALINSERKASGLNELVTGTNLPKWAEENILADAAIYGNVGVYEEGGIYYITFLASNFP